MSPSLMPTRAAWAPDPDVFNPRPWSKLRPEDRRRREELQRYLEKLQRKRELHVRAGRLDGIVTDIDFKIFHVRSLIEAGTRHDPRNGRFHARWDD